MENDKSHIGRLLGGRYELIDVVGVGGMAVVTARAIPYSDDMWRSRSSRRSSPGTPTSASASPSSPVLSPSSAITISFRSMTSETRDGTDYIVMELIEGVTLKEYLQQKGRLSWQESIFFAEQISSALVHAHSRGIIHQDIKPQNVIILRDGTAKLTDFGIASFATTQETRVVQEAIGSVHYISPEQAKGSKIDYRTDIYSLGVVMYEMLTGRLPFEGRDRAPDRHAAYQRRAADAERAGPGHPEGTGRHRHARDVREHQQTLCFGGRAVRRPYARARGRTRSSIMPPRTTARGETRKSSDGRCSARPVMRQQRYGRHPGGTAPAVNPHSHAGRLRRAAAPVRERESSDFFEKLSERPAMAAGMAVAVVAAISLLVVAVLMFTGSDKSREDRRSPTSSAARSTTFTPIPRS